MMSDKQRTGLVADVGGTNTRLGRVNAQGVILDTVVTRRNDAFERFEDMVSAYLQDQVTPSRVVVAVAGPVMGTRASLTNRNWDFSVENLCQTTGAAEAHLINDLEALGASVPTVPISSVEPLHEEASLGKKGQALVVGLGTGFNVSAVDTRSGTVFSAELGHASLPVSVKELLDQKLSDSSEFQTVEQFFSGPGFLRLAQVLGLDVQDAAQVATSTDARALEAIDIATDALAIWLRELAYVYFPRAGMFLNGSLAQLLVSPERRARVLAPLREDTQFEGQFARIPVFRFTSDSVALGGCAAELLRHERR